MEKTPCEPLVGADVEAFVFSDNGDYIPCVSLLPGTKENPFPLDGLGDGYAVQEDNVMAEFNIPPASTAAQFAQSIWDAQDGVRRMLPKGHTLVFSPSAQFKPKDLLSDQAKTIGCEPDFDAYTGGKIRLDPPPLGLWRGAGGHIHLGGDFQCPDFVAALFAEAMIGIPASLSPVPNDKRAGWYGRPGIFRPKPYGIEYRTPSCAWAADIDRSEYIGQLALSCARWLTTTEAINIQTTFRRIQWKDVRATMSLTAGSTAHYEARNNLMQALSDAGLPI